MFHNDDRIVYIATLYKAVVEEEFKFMKEDESSAGADLLCIYNV